MISEIEIVSRQTCFNLRDENLSHQEYREKYELDYIVSGSIRAVDDRLRISVELLKLQKEMLYGVINMIELKKIYSTYKMKSLGRSLLPSLEGLKSRALKELIENLQKA